jgi:hypothetical protein
LAPPCPTNSHAVTVPPKSYDRCGINRNVLFTDGAKFVADEAGAYWLLDTIAICQRYEKSVSAEEFQVWKLKVNADRTACLVCDDGNDNIVYTQHIESPPIFQSMR